MTYAPDTLQRLSTYWQQNGGIALGIVGDINHSTGYHLGKDRIYGPNGARDDDYSVKHPRDKAGLTNAAAAVDLGKLDGTYTGLQEFSRWLVSECQHDAPGSTDIREIIYSPDGSRVERYSGIDGAIHSGGNNGDSSHRFHTHISYFRDSEKREKIALFSGYFEASMDLPPITNTTPIQIDIPVGAAILAHDGKTKVTNNHIARTVTSPYGAHDRRMFALDIDGSGGDTPRSLYFVRDFTVHPPDPEPPESTGPTVLTGDDGSEYRRA